LQEPLRKIQTFVAMIRENENLSDNGKYNLQRMTSAAGKMRQLIDDLHAFSLINSTERKFEKIDFKLIVEEVKADLKDTISEKHATIEAIEICTANVIVFQFRQLMYNLLSNALKFSQPNIPSRIVIKSSIAKGSHLDIETLSKEKDYCHITVKDNGMGFESRFKDHIFEVFKKLHGLDVSAGTGMGLAIVKKIVENHNGIITATGELGKGSTFDIYIPAS
jgi:light-regulated signal transduction histidine kinase (bacteriophytochrome)